MSTRTSQLIEQTLREWDTYPATEDEERFECVVATVECQGRREACAAHMMDPQASIVGPGYTISSAWENAEWRHH